MSYWVVVVQFPKGWESQAFGHTVRFYGFET